MNHLFSGARELGKSFARMRTAGARAASDWNTRMLAEAADDTRRGTRWGRGALAFVPRPWPSAPSARRWPRGAGRQLQRHRGALHPDLQRRPGQRLRRHRQHPAVGRPDGTTTTNTAMARVGFASAGLAGLCGIVHQKIAGVPYSLLLTGGQKVTATPPGTFTTDIDASNLYIQATELQAYGPTTLQNAVLGQSADQVTVAGKPLTGAVPGGFGLGSAGGEGGSSIKLHGSTPPRTTRRWRAPSSCPT